MKRFGILIGGLALVVAALAMGLPSGAAAQTEVAVAGDEAQYAPAGAKTCMKCHDETEKQPVLSILKTPHAQVADPRTPFAQKACESCHGASPQHLEKPAEGAPRKAPTVSFGPKYASPVQVQNGQCLTCHESKLRMHWKGSLHEAREVSCVSCHDVHTQEDAALSKAAQPAVCFACHKQQRADVFKPSTHPIREGQVACSDCHNPHGSSGPKLLVRGTVNETCYTCHADKRGPFLWEHQPVREDCRNCHTPHGSIQPRLLNARMPYLCQQCHMETFHPSTLYSGTGAPPLGAAQQLLGKSCINCHSQIHGSNHPSGPRFTR